MKTIQDLYREDLQKEADKKVETLERIAEIIKPTDYQLVYFNEEFAVYRGEDCLFQVKNIEQVFLLLTGLLKIEISLMKDEV